MEEINKKYKELCVILGDITVKQKGLDNQKAHIFAQLEELDREVAKLMQQSEEPKDAGK